jgi:hypothetical protein
VTKRFARRYSDGSFNVSTESESADRAREPLDISSDDADTELVEVDIVITRSFGRPKLEIMQNAEGWQPIETAPWDTDLLLGWHGMMGEWKTEVGWAGRTNTCPRESGASNGWQHGNATHWCLIPEFSK